MGEVPPGVENKEGKGQNVKIDLKIIRHGERSKDLKLTDYGREVTRNLAASNAVEGDWLDETEVIGSNVNPNEAGVGRALETSRIYGRETDGSAKDPQSEERLNYEHLKTPVPYDHVKVYNSFLPGNYSELPDTEKAVVARTAQQGVIDHLMSLDSEQAITFKKEAAGAFADLVLEYQAKAHEAKSGTSKRVIAGTHGGSMEWLLQQALIHKVDGQEKIGFDDFKVIGGPFQPSESYNVIIETDEQGNDKAIRVIFDDPSRSVRHLELDIEKVKELSAFYKKIHKEENV